MLCRECARGKPNHLYIVEPKNFAVAIPVTLAAASFGGWLMATLHVGFFGLFAGFLYGLAVGEVALRLTGRKRGLQVELMAGGCVFLGLIAGQAIHFFITTAVPGAQVPLGGVDVLTSSEVALRIVTDPWMWVASAVAIFGAVSRVRNI